MLFATDASRGCENRLLAAEWKAFVPHTVRRGTVTCSECHDSPRRFLLEADADRLYELEKDGLPLRSFWSRDEQTVVNGSFLPEDRHQAMNRKTPEYVRQYLRQWQNLLRSRRSTVRALILSLVGGAGAVAIPDPARGCRGAGSGVGAGGGRAGRRRARPAASTGWRWCARAADFFAIDLTCTHLGCTVKATEHGFACPCHGSRFGPRRASPDAGRRRARCGGCVSSGAATCCGSRGPEGAMNERSPSRC